MSPSWESITSFVGLLGGALGFGVAHGKLRQKVRDMDKQIEVNTGKIESFDKRLGDGDATFKVIDTKLDNLIRNQDKMDVKLDTMDDRLRRHCEEKP